ncbi:hypothetical protein PYJP_16450 [Pyrofollis japonicus]|uniref:rhomboid family intramembrane serine protease n=1 Tax=Pyrofollis japonicus TaxID=3060460 RepID=UPI00295B5C4B|nr:rhomboid family intramembrane serine protease [Pyrofollis japonicus]BEP18293.1 hypothetical protein PYJP_16450 [Pyrofollis japonicus]
MIRDSDGEEWQQYYMERCNDNGQDNSTSGNSSDDIEYLYYGQDYDEDEDLEKPMDPISAFLCEISDTSPEGSFWATIALIVVNIFTFLFTLRNISDPVFIYKYLPTSACILSGGCDAKILYSMFMHAGFLHLIGNMIYLYIVGDNIEIALGRIRYLFLYISSGLIGAYTQALITYSIDSSSLYLPMLGASAAISGVIGAYVLLYPGSAMCKCLGVGFGYYCFKIKASYYLASWALLQLFLSLLTPYVAVWAHLGGFFTGLSLAYLLADKDRVNNIRKMLAKGLYSGLRPDTYELHVHSLGRPERLAIVITAALFSLLLLNSLALALHSHGGYFTIYIKKVRVCESMFFCHTETHVLHNMTSFKWTPSCSCPRLLLQL